MIMNCHWLSVPSILGLKLFSFKLENLNVSLVFSGERSDDDPSSKG